MIDSGNPFKISGFRGRIAKSILLGNTCQRKEQYHEAVGANNKATPN
jgi:hypothetical protein